MRTHTVALATFSPRAPNICEDIPTVDLLPPALRPVSRWNITSLVPGAGSKQLARTIKELAIDVVFCHYATTAVHFRKVWDEVPVPLLIHCHGYDVTWTKGRLLGLINSRGPRYQGWLRRLANRALYVANSNFTKSRMTAVGIAERRIEVKYLGVPVQQFSQTIRKSGSSVEILYLGRFIDCKGPDLTIQAFELACQMGLNGRLRMAGGGPMLDHCKTLCERSPFRDRIELLGAVDSATGEALRRTSDIFTVHNRIGPTSGQEEAYGVSVVEAMADGLPVVGTRSGGVIETVVDQVTGFLVTPSSVSEHARALLTLSRSSQLRFNMGKAGHQRAKELFSEVKEKSRIEELLERAIAER